MSAVEAAATVAACIPREVSHYCIKAGFLSIQKGAATYVLG